MSSMLSHFFAIGHVAFLVRDFNDDQIKFTFVWQIVKSLTFLRLLIVYYKMIKLGKPKMVLIVLLIS